VAISGLGICIQDAHVLHCNRYSKYFKRLMNIFTCHYSLSNQKHPINIISKKLVFTFLFENNDIFNHNIQRSFKTNKKALEFFNETKSNKKIA